MDTTNDMVIFSVDGQRRLVDYLPVTQTGISTELKCGEYLIGQAKMALTGAYVPEETIHYKSLNVNPAENKTSDFLESLVSRNLTDQLPSIPLRQLTFVYENHPGELEDLSGMESWMEILRNDSELQKTVRAYEQYHAEREQDIQNRTVTAIRTEQGVLLFNDSGRGLQCVTDYLQDIADRYYCPDFKDLKSLQIYYFSTSNPGLVQESRQCAAMFSPDNPHQFIPSKANFLDSRIMEGFSPAIECSMAPDMKNYTVFTNIFDLEKKNKNLNIGLLDDICKNGLYEYRYKDHPDFSHKNSFEGILDKLWHSYIYEPEHQFLKERLHKIASDTAKRILQTNYEVRGYEPVKQEKKEAKRATKKNSKSIKL